MTRKILLSSVCVLIPAISLFVLKGEVHAESLSIENYDVDVTINQDSTFDVSETITYRATGEYHRIWREITLEDYDAALRCEEQSNLQCGGFSYIAVTGVYDGQGNRLPDSAYSLEKVASSYEDRLKILWEYAPSGRTFNNELFTWTVEYKVYGGLGYFDDYDLFYWDVFYPDRDYQVKKGSLAIHFTEDINFADEDLKLFYNTFSYNYEYDYDDSTNTLEVWIENLPSYEQVTTLLKFPKGIVDKYATLNLELNPNKQNLWVDGIEIEDVSEKFEGVPPGSRVLKFVSKGYEPQEFTLYLKPGEVRNLSVELNMTLEQKLMYVGVILGNVCSCVGGLVLIGLIILNYARKGKDIGGKKTIVPWFRPPSGVSPVIVGSIKDERVSLTDVTSTIINAAVRGYIKIKEIGKKKYELIKLRDFVDSPAIAGRKVDYQAIDKVEVKILKDIFGTKDIVKTEDLKNKFYLKIPGINKAVYEEMTSRQYFSKNPDKVRKEHMGLGIVMLVLGGILTAGLPVILIFTCGPSIIAAGIVKLIFSFFMPAKTAKGTEIFEKAKGFRMFLHTAERFRLQKLTPEKFERFLPYAMVFGVEKEWAKNFKDIYKQPPGWYEGRNAWDTFNTIYLVNALSGMNTNVGRTLSSTPARSGGWSSSGWSGGGWSGGGGFSGGFSGGGGGGGGGGMS
ncbi:MAG: DUF2207 domain-containing protein [Candidatus Dojkabacteria bacterium]|nr:DUF2207 domain-containing protein [Candidatus Dojkabacteria bacterium]